MLILAAATQAAPPAKLMDELAACQRDIATYVAPDNGVGHFNRKSYEEAIKATGPRCHRTWRGIDYILQSDWSGTIETPSTKWRISCKSDAMNDKRSCTLFTGALIIIKDGKYGNLLDWGEDKYPMRGMMIRFGSSSPVNYNADGPTWSQSERLYKSMQSNTKVSVRWTSWPYDTPIDQSVDLIGFEAVAQLYDAIFAAYKKG